MTRVSRFENWSMAVSLCQPSPGWSSSSSLVWRSPFPVILQRTFNTCLQNFSRVFFCCNFWTLAKTAWLYLYWLQKYGISKMCGFYWATLYISLRFRLCSKLFVCNADRTGCSLKKTAVYKKSECCIWLNKCLSLLVRSLGKWEEHVMNSGVWCSVWVHCLLNSSSSQCRPVCCYWTLMSVWPAAAAKCLLITWLM